MTIKWEAFFTFLPVSSNKMCKALEKFALELQNAEINGFAIMKFDNLRVVAKVCSGKVLTDFVSVAGVKTSLAGAQNAFVLLFKIKH